MITDYWLYTLPLSIILVNRLPSFTSPFDVRLPLGKERDEGKDEEIYNGVQPNPSVICEPSKLDELGCNKTQI